nr:DUF1361 domain-containing protein [Secundilactobacillus kimchicus]
MPLTKIKDQLLLIIAINLVFILLAGYLYSRGRFVSFLSKNLILALIPLDIAYVMQTASHQFGFIKAPLLFIWVLFYPNTMYMLTDFSHLYMAGVSLDRPESFINYFLIVLAAIAGVLIGIHSLRLVASSLKMTVPVQHGFFLVMLLFPATPSLLAGTYALILLISLVSGTIWPPRFKPYQSNLLSF